MSVLYGDGQIFLVCWHPLDSDRAGVNQAKDDVVAQRGLSASLPALQHKNQILGR
jgi:hypothetical protein